MALETPSWIQYTEKVVGEGHPTLADVANRPAKTIQANVEALDKKVEPLHFIIQGDASVDTKLVQALITKACTVSKVSLYADTAPAGAALIVDVNKNGTTIFTTQSNRPQIADGANSGNTTTIEAGTFAEGDRLSIDIDQVGSSTPGGNDLLITVDF